MKCKNCGYELRETDKFCNECGAKVVHTDVNSYQQCSNEISKESVSLIKNKSKKTLYKRPIFWIIATEVLLLVIVLIIIISVCNNSTGYIKKPVENYNKVVTTTVVKENQSEANIATESSSTAEPITEEPTTEPPTEKPTEPPTEKPTERKIKNNTSTDNFWVEGSGDYVATGLKVTGYGVLHIEYYGEGNFSVISYENDDYDNLLVNEIGNYSGDVLVDHSGTFELEISAEGSWKITSSGLSVDDVTSFSGTGDCVTGLTSHSGGTWKISHNGDSNFAVIEYGLNEGYMDLLVNEIGDYNGTVKVESGDDIFFKVSADGAWTIDKK